MTTHKRVPRCVRTAPEFIWLQISDDPDHLRESFPTDHEGITWCQDSVLACEVKYVRADIAKLKEGLTP